MPWVCPNPNCQKANADAVRLCACGWYHGPLPKHHQSRGSIMSRSALTASASENVVKTEIVEGERGG